MGRRFVWRIAGFIAAAFLLIAVMLTIGVVLAGTAVGLIVFGFSPLRRWSCW